MDALTAQEDEVVSEMMEDNPDVRTGLMKYSELD